MKKINRINYCKYLVLILLLLCFCINIKNVEAADGEHSKECIYNIKIPCGDCSLFSCKTETCDAKLTLYTIKNTYRIESELDIYENPDKWYDVVFSQAGVDKIKPGDIDNTCPSTIYINAKPANTVNLYVGLTPTAYDLLFRGESGTAYSIDITDNQGVIIDSLKKLEMDNKTKINETNQLLHQEYPDNNKLETTVSSKCAECVVSSGEITTDYQKIATNKNISDGVKQAMTINRNSIQSTKNYSGELSTGTGTGCSLIDPELLGYINKILGYIKIIVPILLILFGGFDFGKAVLSGDNDALKKATTSFVKRSIAAIVIFFLPTIIDLLFSLPGIKELVTDPLCGVR